MGTTFCAHLMCVHRRLQSCVDTRLRLDYAAFDVQLRKAYHYTLRYTYICVRICYMLVTMAHVFAFGPCDKNAHDLK